MAIYHFSAKMISRATGRSAVAAAAYRSASRLPDERLDRDHDFSNKSGVVHSEVLLPENAPEEFADRSTLWNAVEAAELRKDAQLAREVEFAIPREMNQKQGIELARDFVQREFVDKGMIADLNVHWDIGADGEAKPHAHVMLTTREIGEEGFGVKVRDWNATSLLNHWREAWGSHVNQRCAELGIDARIDHRSHEDLGLGIEPQNKLGPAASRMLEQGGASERAQEHLEIARRNGERILADPGVGLDAITHQQSTFTVRDLARLAHRHSDGKEQFDKVLAAMRGSDQLVALGKDGRGEDRFTTRQMIETELGMMRHADWLDRRGHVVDRVVVENEATRSAKGGLVLSGEQHDALRHVTRGRDLSLVIGYAGSGKSAMLAVARAAWGEQGYNVRGAALSGIAAENLQSGSGIQSRTIASLEHQWTRDRERLTANDVLVIDEAGMVGSRQMERVLREASQTGAKVVLVGDARQLQAIEAGAAFRLLAERHGAAEIGEVRRQREAWQRKATRQLATGRTTEALRAYEDRDAIRVAVTRERARANLIERWDAGRHDDPARSRLILAHTRDDVRELNDLAHDALKHDGTIGEECAVKTTRGDRLFGAGDRLMFLKNEPDLGVKNGSLATVERADPRHIDARLDDGRRVGFDLKDYADIDHGYAATIHKAQGVTVDSVHVLATPGMDRHSAYVALSRHRDGVELHYGQDDFADMPQLARVLGRERVKDTTLDYEKVRERFAETRGYDRSTILDALDRNRSIDPGHVRSGPSPRADRFAGLRDHLSRQARPDLHQPRSPFAGLKLNATLVAPQLPRDDALAHAVQRYAAAHEELAGMRAQGLPTLTYQRDRFARAAEALDKTVPHATGDLTAAFTRRPELIADAANGRTQEAIRAMRLEAEVRTNPELRADRFAESWKGLKAEHGRLEGWQNEDATRGPLALAIRRQVAASLTLQDYEAGNHFAGTRTDMAGRSGDEQLGRLIRERRFAEALALAVRARRNIIVAGGTSSGKTTFLNALLREIPPDERLILIEDTPELVAAHENIVGLVSVRGELGEARVKANDLVSASLRLRPDRIILGELRGPEAFAFLRAINTGHPGSMTTIHADSPESAVEQLVMLVLQGGTRLSRDDVRHYVQRSIDLFVQLSRIGGRRSVEAVVLSDALDSETGVTRR